MHAVGSFHSFDPKFFRDHLLHSPTSAPQARVAWHSVLLYARRPLLLPTKHPFSFSLLLFIFVTLFASRHTNSTLAFRSSNPKSYTNPTRQKDASLQPPPPFRLRQKIQPPKLLIHNALFYNRESPSRTPEKRLDCHRITLCTIAAQTPPTQYSISNLSINTIAGKNHKKPHHPSKVQSINCLTAKACGRWLPLLYITLQGCTSLRHLSPVRPRAGSIPFIVSPQPRLPTQECFHSFHCAHAYPPFHSAPLWLFHPQPETQSQNVKLHSTQP